jgi:hypothetical protein
MPDDLINVPEAIRKTAIFVRSVGSRVTCDPPPMDTDQDFLVLLPRSGNIRDLLPADEWELDGSFINDEINRTEPEHRFTSYSREFVNLIVTFSPVFAQRFLAASSVAKRLNLLKKEDRIALFQAVLYGNESQDNVINVDNDKVEF